MSITAIPTQNSYLLVLLMALAVLASACSPNRSNEMAATVGNPTKTNTTNTNKPVGPAYDKAQQVIDAAIAAHGGALYNHVQIDFVFRNRQYQSYRKAGMYRYFRAFEDTTEAGNVAQFKDTYSNDGFERTVNGQPVALSQRKVSAYGNAVNSVLYFVQLPYGLNDAAVVKAHLGTVTIKGQTYDKVRVTFLEEGGGTDFEDVFVYWFNTDTHLIDYLAYEFHVNGGGIRFREAINQREVGGLVFNDYVNYKLDHKQHTVEEADQLFEADALIELSRIVSEQVQVQPL